MGASRGEDVDVVIPCFNGERYLARTIDCALAQTHRPTHVLVVDDGSTDSTRRIVEGYGDRVAYAYKSNGGQASARNLGISLTRSPFVCLLDADDLPAPEMIERLVRHLAARPEVDLVSADVLGIFGEDSAHPYAETWRPAVTWPSYVEALSIFCTFHGSATVMRRGLFETHGLFSESRSLQGCEDWHFFLRAALGGAVFDREPGSLCLYRYHPQASGSSGRAVARRETELMKTVVPLFRAGVAWPEANWSILSAGVMSVAARWIPLNASAQFNEMRTLSESVAPPGFRRVAPIVARTGTLSGALANLQLAENLLDLGRPALAAVLFLRGRDWPRLSREALRHGQSKTLDRVCRAMHALVSEELRRPDRGSAPSYATHLATALGLMSRASGRTVEARERFEDACRLDANNVRPAIELLELDVKAGRWISAVARWKNLGAQGEEIAPDRVKRVARDAVIRATQLHPSLREAARRISAAALSIRRRP